MVLIVLFFLLSTILITKQFVVFNAEALVCFTFTLFTVMILVFFKQSFVGFFAFKKVLILKELNSSKQTVTNYLAQLYDYLGSEFRSLNFIYVHLLFLKYAKWACLAQAELILIARLEFYILEQLKRLTVLEFIFQQNISFSFSFGIEAKVRSFFLYHIKEQKNTILIASIKALS